MDDQEKIQESVNNELLNKTFGNQVEILTKMTPLYKQQIEGFVTDYLKTSDQSFAELESVTNDAYYIFFVIFGEKERININSIACVLFVTTNILYISFLYTRKDQRKKGLANSLIKAIKDYAHENGCERIRAGIIKNNLISQQFFSHHDFDIKFYGREWKDDGK